MNKTSIQWTSYSSTPLRYRKVDGKVVWACIKTSPGCANCYAESLAFRWNRGVEFSPLAMEHLTPFVDDDEVRSLLTAKKIAGQRLFLNDMTDWMGDWVPTALIDLMVAVMVLRPDVTFQTLTKRAARQLTYFSAPDLIDRLGRLLALGDPAGVLDCIDQRTRVEAMNRIEGHPGNGNPKIGWPLQNLHVGVSMENQPQFDARISHLKLTPAVVRFISFEPLLGPIDPRVDTEVGVLNQLAPFTRGDPATTGIGWMICGGESGAARPCDEAWIAALLAYGAEAGTRRFVKQLGAKPVRHGVPFKLKDGHGGDPAEWDPALRVREFPEARI